MPLKDFSLTKDAVGEVYNDLYSFTDDSYKQVSGPAAYFKQDLKYLIKLYSGMCGENEQLSQIFANIKKYISIPKGDKDLFSAEASCVKDILLGVVDYEDTLEDSNAALSRKVNNWLDKIDANDSKRLSLEEQQQNATFVGYVELSANRRIALMSIKFIFLDLVQGTLPVSECPYEEEDDDSPFNTLSVPMMTHVPCVSDLPQDKINLYPLYKVLYNILNTNSRTIPSFFYDYNNGNVCVRIWKKDEEGAFLPNYIVLEKADIFVNSVAFGNTNVLWLPVLERALFEAGIECFDAKGVAEALLGPDYSEEEINLFSGELIQTDYREDEEYNGMIEVYIKCFFDLYLAFLGTISITEQDEGKYFHVIYALKEVLYALLCCFYTTTDNGEPAVNLLVSKIDAYVEDINATGRASQPLCKDRLAICETARELSEFFLGGVEYHRTPKLYFEKIFAEKIALSLLDSGKKEATKQAVDAKVLELMSDSKCKKLFSGLNIYQLKSANTKQVEAFIKKYLSN